MDLDRRWTDPGAWWPAKAENPGRGSDVSRRHEGQAADAPSSCAIPMPPFAESRVSGQLIETELVIEGEVNAHFPEVSGKSALWPEGIEPNQWAPSSRRPVLLILKDFIRKFAPLCFWGTLLGLLYFALTAAVGCQGAGYTRAEYLNVDGDVYQYAQFTTGTKHDLGGGFETRFGMGERFTLDGTRPRELINVGGSFDFGRLSIYTSADVVGPWDKNPEFSLYTAMELTY